MAAVLAAAGRPFLIRHELSAPTLLAWAGGVEALRTCPKAAELRFGALLSPDGIVGHYDARRWAVVAASGADKSASSLNAATTSSLARLQWQAIQSSGIAEPGCSAEGAPPPRHVVASDLSLAAALGLLTPPSPISSSSGAAAYADSLARGDSAADLRGSSLWPSADGSVAACLAGLCDERGRPFVYLRAPVPETAAVGLLGGSAIEALGAEGPEHFGLAHLSLYVSEAGVQTNLHCDERGALLAQLKGRKRVVLFPPSCRALRAANWGKDGILSPCGRRSWYSDGLQADWAEQPPFKDLGGTEVEVEEGWALYTPRRWWHDVLSLDVETIGLVARCVA